MYISIGILNKAKEIDISNIIKLAHFVGVTTSGRLVKDIIEELHFKLNYGGSHGN